MGLVEENTLLNPLFSWRDLGNRDLVDVDSVGLTSLQSAVFYKFDCSLSTGSSRTNIVCKSDNDCRALANTECKEVVPEINVMMRSCQCKQGYQIIPNGKCFKNNYNLLIN